MNEWLIIFALLVLAGAAWVYNRLVRSRNLVMEAWAGIDVQLQRRAELVPNLVRTVKAYAGHESAVLNSVARDRTVVMSTPGVTRRARAETALSGSLDRLFALAEAYPDLKASDGFLQLQASLVDVENQLQYARRYYNGAVRDNNTLVERFPSNLVAKVFGFRTASFFKMELSHQRSVPDVDI